MITKAHVYMDNGTRYRLVVEQGGHMVYAYHYDSSDHLERDIDALLSDGVDTADWDSSYIDELSDERSIDKESAIAVITEECSSMVELVTIEGDVVTWTNPYHAEDPIIEHALGEMYYIERVASDDSPEGEQVHEYRARTADDAYRIFDEYCRAQDDDCDYSLSTDGGYIGIYSTHHAASVGQRYGDRIEII